MSRRSRRHGRNPKNAASTRTISTRQKQATTIKKIYNKVQKRKPGVRGRGRWRRTLRSEKVDVKSVVQKKSMKQQPKNNETSTNVAVKQEIVDETPDVEADQTVDVINEASAEDETLETKDAEAVIPSDVKQPNTFVDERHDAEHVPLEDEEDLSDNHILTVDESAEMQDIESEDSEEKISAIQSKKEPESIMSLTSPMKQHGTSNQIHQCLVCSKVLSSASSLDRHMLVHSGERPFKCKLCDMAFTTNGNMHRHMRTHGEFLEPVEVAKGVDLRKREATKRKLSLDSNGSKDAPSSEQEKLLCPVCGKSLLCKYGLQSHMETHPNDPILCQSCGEISANYSIHVNHKCNALEKKAENFKSSCCGFRDLNFMDFSTDKFSLVSKSFCEQNVKRPSSAFHVFECSECKKAFPCGRALKLHMRSHESSGSTFCASCDCSFEGPAFLQLHQLKHRSAEHCHWGDRCSKMSAKVLTSSPTNVPVARAGKEDFLALFNLQTKESQLSLLKELKIRHVKEGNFENMDYFVHGKLKPCPNAASESDDNNSSCSNNNNCTSSNDFADIQSILSLTSKAPLIADVHSSPVAVRPMSPIAVIPSQQPESPQEADLANSSPETPSMISAVQPVSADPVPDIDPVTVNNIYSCKICNQKFRTINTLKRHSKMHMQRGSNYSCHLCSYISVDKSTLIRHLRTHNGERPFQCIICKYAFTTKANCERHVRKRHKKLTKPEIRSCMQYNPNMSLRMPDFSPTEISNSETVCKYCNVDFKFNRVLRHHLRSLHNSCNRKPFSCKICSFGFSTKNNCIRHVLKQHPNMKDKLRSVVIPNSKMNVKSPELKSDNTNDTNTSSSSTQSITTPSEQTEPLNLNCRVEEQPLNLTTEEPPPKTVQSEAVIAAESLVSLSETLPPQNEPLDLAIRPLDLSCKSQPLVTNVGKDTDCNCTPQVSVMPARILTIPSPSVKNVSYNSPSRISSESVSNVICPSIMKTSNTCSLTPPKTFSKIEESPRSFGQKYRAFTCIYCSAGFTLKSNMERHIKRKHPEYARPTRSRNFIPAVISSRPQHNNITMLSDKTRDALRHVLNTKVQHNIVSNVRHSVSATNCSSPKEASYINSYTVNINDLGKAPVLIGEKDSFPKVNCQENEEPENLVSRPVNMNVDDNSADLASVSSVICTANSSQQFKQYFEKSPEKKDPTMSEESPQSTNGADTSVSCPFCARKFPWSSSLRRHILTHTGQKPYKCPRCALWFTTKSNCERHLIRKHGHKGDLIYRSVPDRPYKCNQCPSSTFSTQGNLRKHFYLKHWTKSSMGMYSKPSKRPDENMDLAVVEEECKDAISHSAEEHSYSQTEKKKTYECQFCSQNFHEIAHLSKHMQKHKHVIYMCYLCRKTFPTSDGCYTHFKTSHSLMYLQMAQGEVSCTTADQLEYSSDDDLSPKKDEDATAMACMVCFQKIASLEELQQHIKNHLLSSKAGTDTGEISPIATTSSASFPSKNEDVVEKKTRSQKNKVQNSLLYFFTPSSTNETPTNKNSEAKVDASCSDEGSDLIQNLLGIHDSRIIDEMLVSADSAARLLGVKEV